MPNRIQPAARAALLSALFSVIAAAACDFSPFGSRPRLPGGEQDQARLTITCRGDVHAGTLSCSVPATADGDDGPRGAVLRGQGTEVELASANILVDRTADPAVADTFSFDATVRNLLHETMGTPDGTTVDPVGIRVAFQLEPVVTATNNGLSGTAAVAKHDGEATITGTDQPYYQYAGEALGPDHVLSGTLGGVEGEVTAPREWAIAISDNVTTFSFVVVVDAATEPLLAINEVMADPSTVHDSLREYIEVINRGTLAVDLDGWIIQDATGASRAPNTPVAISGSLVIPGGATALLARSSNGSLNGGIAPDYVYSVPGAGGVMQLGNTGGDWVRLRRLQATDTVTIDSVGYTVLPASEASRERLSFGAGSENINDNAFWKTATSFYTGSDRGTPKPLSGVVPGAPEGVSLSTSDPAMMPVGYNKPTFYTVRDSLGNTINTTVTWESLTPAIASVDGQGYVTALAPGTATIQATTTSGSTGTFNYTVVDSSAVHTANYRDHIEFGEPLDGTSADEFAINREEFRASYNLGRRQPNWVSWNLNASQFEQGGTNDVPRCNCFTPESLVDPAGRAYDSDYRGSGYDRGHVVQSESRTNTFQENAVTFLTSNIFPQAGANNQGPWLDLENHLNDLARTGGKEVYVVAGGQYGATPPTLKGEGRVAIPEYTWKAALILDAGEDLGDVASGADVEVIAIRIPNLTEAHATSGDANFAGTTAASGNIQGTPWENYITTVNSIEAATGYDLFRLLGDAIEAEVEARQGTGSAIYAASLDITTEPSAAGTSGTPLAQQPVVRVLDNNGNPFAGAGRNVTAAIASGTGTLAGTATVGTNASGVATFTNLAINGTGEFTLRFTSTGLTQDVSATITVSAAADAAPTVISTSPTNGAGDIAPSANVVVNFSESVSTGASAFALECPAGSAVAVTVSGTGATRTLNPNADLPLGAECQVTVTASEVTDLDGSADAMAANYVFGFTVTATPPTAAVLRLNELHPNITSSRDLIELVAVSGGSTNGIRIIEEATSSATLATLPDVTVNTGDIIVVHLNRDAATAGVSAPASETTGPSQYPSSSYSANVDGAWDFHGGSSGLTFSWRVVRVIGANNATQDGIGTYTSSGTPPGGYPAKLQALQAEGHWLPVDCAGAACTYATVPSVNDISVLYTGTATTRSGVSVRRVSATDTNHKDDWAIGASSIGAANP